MERERKGVLVCERYEKREHAHTHARARAYTYTRTLERLSCRPNFRPTLCSSWGVVVVVVGEVRDTQIDRQTLTHTQTHTRTHQCLSYEVAVVHKCTDCATGRGHCVAHGVCGPQ